MTVKLYTITQDPKTLTKTLIDSGAGANLVIDTDVNMKEGGDVLHPKFTVAGSDLHGVNYAYIPRYRRYYFARVTVDPAGRWWIHCDVDVLMSHAAQLKSIPVTLERSETEFNGYLPDSEYTALGYRAIVAAKFPTGLTKDSYILMTTG